MEVDLKGYALETNATASPTIKSPAYLDVSNFSVEFLKAIMVRLKLLCCQMVEEIVKTNINGWSINANASGLLEVRNNAKCLMLRLLIILTTNGTILLWS
jgi:hypothetical protein